MTAQLKVFPGADQRRDQLIHESKRLTGIFCRECGFKPLPYMAREFARYLAMGYEVDMLEEVIRITSWAPRPTFAYLAAIMRNHFDDHTLSEFHRHDRRDEYNPDLERFLDSIPDEELDEILGVLPLKPYPGKNQKHQEEG